MATFDDMNKDKKNDNWFLKTAFKISIFGGAFFAINKMKGPTKDLVHSIFVSQLEKIKERESYKATDYFGKEASIYNAQTVFKDIRTRNITSSRNTYKSTASAINIRAEIESLENRIVNKMERDIYDSKVAPTRMRVGNDIFGKYTMSDIEASNLIKSIGPIKIETDEMFFELRRDALFNYLEHNNSIGNNDLKLLATLKDPIKDKETLKNIFSEYLSMDPEFATLYSKNISRARMRYNKDIAKVGKEPLDPDIVKSKLIGSNIRKTTIDDTLRMRIGYTSRATTVMTSSEFNQLFKSGNKITSGSLNKKAYIPKAIQYQNLGNYEYTSYIKQIADQLDYLNDEKFGFRSLFWEIVEDGRSDMPRYYFKVTATHITTGKEFVHEIPIAQWDRLPGSSAWAAQRKDVGDLVTGHNTTILAFKNFLRALKSKTPETFLLNPSITFKRFRDGTRNTLIQASRLEGNAKDALPLYSTRDTRIANKLVMERAIDSMTVLRQLSGSARSKGALTIAIDLETISDDMTHGPDINARSAETKITQFGFSASEIDKRGNINFIDNQTFFSDHGVDNMRWNEQHSPWLMKYLPDKEQKRLNGASPSEIGEAFGIQMKALVKSQRKSFVDNAHIANYTINRIIGLIQNNRGKTVYLTTKFGTAFDLKILSIYAPEAYTRLVKMAPHLDIHGVAHIRRILNGRDESLSQEQAIKEMMGNYGYKDDLDLSKGDDIGKAFEFLKKKGNVIMSAKMLKRFIESKAAAAHNAGTDTMLLHLLVGFEVNKYNSGQKEFDFQYAQLKELFYWNNKRQTLEDQYLAGVNREHLKVFGINLSASALSHGRISKQFLSSIGNTDFLTFPDNPVAKQFYQMLVGNPVIPSKEFLHSIKDAGDIVKRRAIRKLHSPVFQKAGMIDAESYYRNADASTNQFSHTVLMKYFSVMGSFGGEDSATHLSRNIFKKANLWQLREGVNLSEVATDASSVNLSEQIRSLYDKIQIEAEKICAAGKGGHGALPGREEFEAAAINVMAKENTLTKLPAGSHVVMTEGDKGVSSFKAPVDGKLTNLNVIFKNGKLLNVFADIEYLINSENCTQASMIMRGMSTKSIALFDEATTQGLMYGGVDGWGPAQFLNKGYTGNLKSITMMTGFENLVNIKETGTAQEAADADKLLRKWSKIVGADYDPKFNTITMKSDTSIKFKKITDVSDLEDARKFVGNIDMNIGLYTSFMADARQIWTLEKAQQWYGFWGGGNKSDLTNGRKNAQKAFMLQVAKIREDIYGSKSEIANALNSFSYSRSDKDKIFKQQVQAQASFMLPSIRAITKGAQIPMAFEVVEQLKGTGMHSYGIRHSEIANFYGLLNGNDARSVQVKIHSSLANQLGGDFNDPTVTPATRELYKKAKAYNSSGKLAGVAISRSKFLDVLTTSKVIKGTTDDALKTLLSLKTGLDIEKLKRVPLTSTEKILVLEKATNIITDKFKTHPEVAKEMAEKMVSDIEDTSWAEAVMDHKNRSFISQQSAHNIANIKGPLALSALKGLDDNVFTLDLNDLMSRMSDKDDVPSKKQVMSLFKKLQTHKNGFIHDIIDTETKQIIKLNYLMMAGPEHFENVINLLGGREDQGFGYVTNEFRAINEVANSYDILKQNLSKSKDKAVIKDSHTTVMKQYLNYMLRTIHSADEEKIVPWGLTARAQDSNEIYVMLKRMQKSGWKGYTGNIEEANAWTNRIMKDFQMSDVFIHETLYKNEVVINNLEHDKIVKESHYKKLVATLGPEKADIVWKTQSFTGSLLRQPLKAAGYNGSMETRYNVMPKEIADAIGQNVNTFSVAAELWKLPGGDFDADLGYMVWHAFETANTLTHLSKLRDEQRSAFNHTLSSIVKDNGELKTLQDQTNNTKRFISMSATGGMEVGVWKNGVMTTEVLSADSAEAQALFAESTNPFGKVMTQIGMHDASIVTPGYIKNKVDQVALIEPAKNAIGVFTNTLDKRMRQILKMDATKSNVIRKDFIGNYSTGLAGQLQDIIGLVKHQKDIHEISMATNALTNPFDTTKESEAALFKYMAPLYKTSESHKFAHEMLLEGTRQNFKHLGPKEAMARMTYDSLEDIELGKSFSMFDFLTANQGVDYSNLSYSIPEQSVKQAKLSADVGAFFKKGGIGRTGAAIGAAVYIASNFFKPNQLSNSLNPMDAFTDLGTDIDGNHNAFSADLELERSVPLDMVNASFSKQAFVRMNKDHNKRDRSHVIQNILNNGYQNTNPLLHEWKTPDNLTYTNYTSNIGYFGSSQLDRRANY